MKKTKLFKSLLVAAGLLVGANAWADTYYSQDYEASGVTADWTTATSGRFTPVIMEESGNHFLSVDQSTRNNNGTTITSTSTEGKVAAGSDFTMTFDMRLSSSSNQTATEFIIYDAANSGVMLSLKETGTWATTWTLNGTSTQVTLPNSNKANSSNTIADVTWCSYKISRSNGVTYLTITNKADNSAILERTIVSGTSETGGLGKMVFISSRYMANFAIDNIVVRDIEDGDVPQATPTTYTLKYVDEGGTPIQDDVVVNSVAGIEVSASADQIAAVYANNKKYIYKSGNETITTVEDGNSNVITLVYREAATWSYTVNAVNSESTILATIASGTAFEGDAETLGYPFYVNVEGTLWTKAATNKEFRTSFTVSEDNYIVNLEYTATEITNVIYLEEIENVAGVTVFNTGNSQIRSSNAASGYSSEKITLTTLQSGKYNIYGVACVATGTSNFSFNLGNREVLNLSSSANNWATGSAEFIVASEKALTFNGGNSNQGLDFIYIQQLGEPTEEELTEAAAADIKADKAARVFSIVGENVTGGWENDYAMTQSTKDGEEDIYTLTLNDFEAWPGTTYEYKLRDNNDWDGFVLPAGDNASFTVDKGGVYKLIFTADVANYTLNVQKILTKSYTYTASYTNTYNWGSVYAYAWSGEGDSKVEQLGGWPGTQIYADANGIYTATILNKIAPEYIIFNANDGNQTGNLVFVDGSIYNYNGDKSVAINVTAAGYATYCSELALDFTAVEGLTAYKATITGTEVKFEKVEKVPAGEGVLVKAAAGKYTVPSIASADAIENALVGVIEPKTIPAGSFVLMKDTSGVGFYKTNNEFTVGANTAYLPALASNARFIGFDFDDNTTTAIEGVATVKMNNGEIFNLQGQRVTKATKGLYIINGKKVMVK